MQIVFRLVYSLAVAILFVLFVILGTRTFYAEPDDPSFPVPTTFSSAAPQAVKCDLNACFDPKTGTTISLEEARRLYPADVAAEEEAISAQQEYQANYQKYLGDRVDYHRNVFILASILGVLAVAAAVYLFGRVDAMPLGLLLGGIGVINFGWIQAAGDLDEIGVAPLFAVVSVGLALVMAAGYRFLGVRAAAGSNES